MTRLLAIDPAGIGTYIEGPDTLRLLQDAVGGYVDIIQLDKGDLWTVDDAFNKMAATELFMESGGEEGKDCRNRVATRLVRQTHGQNILLLGGWVWGTCVLATSNGEGQTTDVSEELVAAARAAGMTMSEVPA
jgi:hypothetical protein